MEFYSGLKMKYLCHCEQNAWNPTTETTAVVKNTFLGFSGVGGSSTAASTSLAEIQVS